MTKRAVTMPELLIASSVAFLILGVVFALWTFSEKAWYGERIKTKLLGEMEMAVERIKQELQRYKIITI